MGILSKALTLEPALVQGAILAIFNVLALFGVSHFTDAQMAGVNAAVAAILALFVRQAVTPVARLTSSSSRPRDMSSTNPGGYSG